MKNNLNSLVKTDNALPTFRTFGKTYKLLKDNPQLVNLSFLSISRISNIKSSKRQKYVIEKIIDRIEHPKISNYLVMGVIRSSKGKDINEM